jgi:glutathione S-transferase
MLVVHHLGRSQSDRIVWLCEELGLPYELRRYDREPTGAAPPEYKRLHFFGTAPVIQDGDVVLGESGAIVEYICRKHGNGRLTAPPNASNFAQYLYWFHFANGTFVPGGMMALAAPMPIPGFDPAQRERMRRHRFDRAFDMVERRLGEQPYFAGPEFTAADIMMVFPMTMMRRTIPRDISGSPNTLAYLQRIGARPAFQRACRKGDPDLVPNLT